MSSLRFSAQRIRQRAGTVAVQYKAGHWAFTVLTIFVAVALVLSACSRRDKASKPSLSKRVVQLGEPVPKGGGRYKVGSPYKIGGRWYWPKEDQGYNRVGVASWYGEMFHGRYTANGEIYDMDALSAAHPTLPMPSYVRVTNLQNARALVLRLNDRGPYAHDRVIDLSRRSAQALGFERQGTARVRVQYLGRAPLDGNDSLERRVYASQPWARHARLNKRPARGTRRTRLARVAEKNIHADPMVVGSILKEDNAPRRTSSWETVTDSASALPVPSMRNTHFIQAASFQNRDFADALRQRLASLGPANVFPANVAGKTYYRVRLGPYDTRHDADEMLRAVVSSGISDARIIRN